MNTNDAYDKFRSVTSYLGKRSASQRSLNSTSKVTYKQWKHKPTEELTGNWKNNWT